MAIRKEQFLEIEKLIKSNVDSIKSLIEQSAKLGDQIVKMGDDDTKKATLNKLLMMKKDKQYKKNFIKLVVLKIDFERISNFDHLKFSELELFKDYPTKKEQQKTDFVTILSKERQSFDKINYNEYRYYDLNMENCICLCENALFFEIKSHFSFTDLKNQFSSIFEALKKNYNIESFTRIGLRYINNINIEDGIKKAVSKELLSNDSFIKKVEKEDDNFRKALSLGRIAFKKDDTVTNFVYGHTNKNYPAILINKSFLLDYDSFATNVHVDSLISKLDVLHDNIRSLFEISITDELRSIMNKN